MCLPRPNLVDTGSHAPATVRADGNHGPADLRFLTASDNPRGTGLAGPFGPFRPPLQDTRGGPVTRGGTEPGRGRNLKNTNRSSPVGHFGRLGYVKPPRAPGERARWVMAAPCSTGRAGGGRAWGAGREIR